MSTPVRIPRWVKSKRYAYDNRGFLIGRNQVYEVYQEEDGSFLLLCTHITHCLDKKVLLAYLDSGTLVKTVKTKIRYENVMYEYYDEMPLSVQFNIKSVQFNIKNDLLGSRVRIQCSADDYKKIRDKESRNGRLDEGYVYVFTPESSGQYSWQSFGSTHETAMAVDISVSEVAEDL